MQGVVGSLIIALLQIYYRIYLRKNFETRLRIDRIMATSLVCSFLGPLCAVHVQ